MLLNNNSIRSVGALGLLMIAASSASAGALAPQKASADTRMTTGQGQRALAAKSARFLENKGQWDARAKFLAKGAALDLWFTEDGIRYDQHPTRGKYAKRQVVDMFFRGGKSVRNVGRFDTGSRSDYYVSGKVALNARSYKELYAHNVVDGVDMRTYFDGGRPRYDLIVAPGAKPSAIKLGFRGAEGLSVKKGELVVGTQLGGFTNGKPFAYQKVNGKQKPVAVRWTLLNGSTATFALGNYDQSKPLVIDPVVYGTYFGGDDGVDEVHSIVSDTPAGGTEGSVLVTGATRAVGFPTSTGIDNYNNPNGVDAFLSRLQGDAYNRDYSVFVGGAGYDIGKYVKLDARGNIWVAGITTSGSFFNTSGGTLASNDVFVLRFNNNGTLTPQVDPSGLMRFGATSQDDILTGFDVLKTTPNSANGITKFVLGGIAPTTAPAGFPGTHPGISTGYIATFQFQSGVFYRDDAAYMVGAGGVRNEVRGVVYGPTGAIYVGGTAYGTGNQNTDPRTGGNPNLFFTTSDVFKATSTGYDGGQLLRNSDLFVRVYNPNWTIAYSGFIGGAGNDDAGGYAVQQSNSLNPETDFNAAYTGSTIAVDSAGAAYITGVSRSFNFPRTNGVYGEVFDQFEDVTVTKINPTGSALTYSTNLRTSSGTVARTPIATVAPAGIGVDNRGNAFITGNLRPNSIAFPQPTPGDPNEPSGMTLSSINIPASLTDVPDPLYESPATPEYPTSEGFIMVLNPTATALEFASYLGGILDDFVYAPFVDNNGDVWTMGWTDGRRAYQRVSSTNAVTNYNRTSSLPGTLITPLALKSSPDISGTPQTTISYPFGYGITATQGAGNPPAPAFVNGTFARDGFIVKFRVNQPSVASVTLNPATIPGGLGASSAGTVTLSQAAPSGGAQVRVSLPNGTTYASLSATDEAVDTITLDIPAGATQATFTVYSKPVTENQLVKVRATYTGTFKETTLQVVPWLVSLQLPSNTMVGGDPNNMRGVVTLASPAPAGGVEVSLTASDSAVQFVTKPFVVPAGQTSAQFEISSAGVDAPRPVTVQASLLGLTRSADLTLIPATLQSITLTPSTVAGGSPTVATVTLNGKAGDLPYVVTITSSNASAVVPAGTTITVAPQNVTSTTGVTINTLPVSTPTTATITATHEDSPGHPFAQRSATLTIQPVVISGLVLDPATIESGGTSVATLTLSTTAPTGGARVYVSTSDSTVAVLQTTGGDPLPSDGTGTYVTVPEGDTQVTFNVQGRYVGVDTTIAITATGGTGGPRSANLTVKALDYVLSIDPASVVGSSAGTNVITGTVTIPTAALETLTFNVSTNNASVFPAGTFDATVTIPVGSTTGTFTLRPRGVTEQTTVVVSVAFKGAAKTIPLEIRPVGLSSLVSRQTTVRGGTGQINLTAFFEAETSIANGELVLATNLPSAFPTGTFTLQRTGPYAGQWIRIYSVPAGVSSYALFPALMPKRISRSQNVTFTAYYSGTSASTTVTVAR